jgi:hypothetical protein
MRIPTVTILLAGGMLALGACSTSITPADMAMAEAEAAHPCPGRSELVPTGRTTGDPRQDYRCRSVHTMSRERAARNASGGRNQAIDRALSGRSGRG